MAGRARWAVAALLLWGLAVGGVPLLAGLPGGDDAYYHAMRAQQQARCWRLGVLFPRWYPDLNGGLGGAEPRAYTLLSPHLLGLLALATDDAVAATALATLLLPPFAAACAFAAGRRRGASLSGSFLAGVAWAAAPYLVISLHERVALAELFGLAMLPWLLAISLPPHPVNRDDVAKSALGWALLLACHLPLALMSALAVALVQLPGLGWRRAARLVAALAAGTCLSAVSWLPNLAALRYLEPAALTSGWFAIERRFLLTGGGDDPALARQLVLAFAGCAIAAVMLALGGVGTVRSSGVMALGLLLLATPLGSPLYHAVPLLSFIQFPWRWLGVAGALAVLALALSPRRFLALLAGMMLLAPLLAVDWSRWRLPEGEPLRPSDPPVVAARAATRYGVPPILPSPPSYLPRAVSLPVALATAARARAALPLPLEAGPRRWRWKLRQAAPTAVVLPLLSDPGWEASVDGAPAGWAPVDGLVAVAVPTGAHEIAVRQSWLLEDLAGGCLSALSLLVVLSAWRRRRPEASTAPRQGSPEPLAGQAPGSTA